MNVAAGHYSHAEGLGTLAGGKGAHSEGTGTRALEENSHAEGNYAQAYKFSHAEGNYTEALGRGAHAEGDLTVANGLAQHVEGTLNIKDTLGGFSTPGNYIHIAGNGRNVNARSNAYTLDWAGNGWFAGDVYTGSTSGTNKDAGSKKLATDDTFIGTNGTENGSKGLVPAPTFQDTNKYLKSDGTWAIVSGGGSSYTAGDYINITNNEISVTGIVPSGDSKIEEIQLTSGTIYDDPHVGEPIPEPTQDIDGKIAVIENTDSIAKNIYIKCTGLPGNIYGTYAFKTYFDSEEYPDQEVIKVNYYEPSAGDDITRCFGTILQPGEKLYLNLKDSSDIVSSAYLYTFDENEEQMTFIDGYTLSYDYPNIIVEPASSDYHLMTFTNTTGHAETFYFKGTGFSGSIPFALTDSNNIDKWHFQMGSDFIEYFGDEIYFQSIEMEPNDKFYINFYDGNVEIPATAYRMHSTSAVLDGYIKSTDIFNGTSGASNGKSGLVPAPTASDTDKYLKSDGTWASISGGGSNDYDDLIDKPQINSITLSGNKTTADLGLDMVILSYGNSTWQEFLNAYRRNAVVYCRAGSGSDPASGNQPRLAFMAYINNVTSPTEVEFQYYRSVSTKTASQQGDQVIVYKLTSSGTWTVTTRENGSKVVAGTNMTSSYSNGVLTLNAGDSIFEGTDGTNAGTKGLVPAPTASDTDKYLKSDGTWATVSGGSGNYVSKTGDTMTGTLTTPNIIVGNQKNSTTLGTKSSIFGRDGAASGNYCIVEGDGCTAKDDACHAEGRNCIAGAGGNGGDYAHAEGCETKATGFCSHSEGYYTTASEYYTHAEGEKTVAAGTHSHAEGYGTKANRGFTHVQGIYNILDDTGAGNSKGTYAHIVGNGSADNDRKNIHTIKWTGETWFQGDVYVGSTSGKNKDEGSKKLATEEYVRSLLQEFATLNNLNMPS